MKKKIVSLCLVIALLATAITGATLAYFTDTDEEENVFTMGGVEIDLIEKQYDEDGELEDFEDDKNLMPGKENKQDKIVSIKNTGESDAYVWYEWWIPTALDSVAGDTGTTNVLHVNSYGATWDEYWEAGYSLPADFTAPTKVEETWDHDPEVETKIAVGPEGYIRQETKSYDNGTPDNTSDDYTVKYNVYLVLYRGVLAPNAETAPSMNGVYLDKDLDMDVDANGNVTYTCHGKTVEFDFENEIEIPVKAFGIQTEIYDYDNDGDTDVYDAYMIYNNDN